MKTKNEVYPFYKNAMDVESDFYLAFGTGDFALMKSLYADYGVSCTHPNASSIVGRDNVIENWRFILEGIPEEKINWEILNISKHGNIEIHQVLETFVINKLTSEVSKVYSTNVFILQDNGWRLQTQHSSLPAINKNKPNDNNEYQELLEASFEESRVLN